MSSREYSAVSRTGDGRQGGTDARSAATMAAVLALLLSLAPVVITLGAVMIGPLAPYPVGALVSFSLVAASVALALFFGISGLRSARRAKAQAPIRQRWTPGGMAPVPDRGLATLRAICITAIAFASLHGLLFLASLAITVPGILWFFSVHA